LEVVAKAIYLLNFSLDRLCARLHCGLFQGCGAIVKMTQLRLRSVSSSELLVFMSVAPVPELSFNMAPASVRFHTLIFQLSLCASS